MIKNQYKLLSKTEMGGFHWHSADFPFGSFIATSLVLIFFSLSLSYTHLRALFSIADSKISSQLSHKICAFSNFNIYINYLGIRLKYRL